MKTRMKRLISLLCAVTVFASTALSTDFLSAKVEASGGQEKESLPTDMTEISFRDFSIADIENHQGWAGKEYTGETLDNTLFSGTVIFPKVADAYITYAGEGPQEGLSFTVAQNENTQEWYLRLAHSNKSLLGTLQNEKIYANAAGVEQLVGAPLELHISMEYVNLDDQGEETDLKLGVWFGDTLYKDEYIYIKDYVGASKTGNYLTYNSKKADGGAITLRSTNIKLPNGMTEITLKDFNIADDEYSTSFSGNYAGQTMDNTLFSAKIKYSQTGVSHFVYGGTKSFGGFALQNAVDQDEKSYLRMWDTDRENMKFQDKKFYADKAGVGTFIDKEFTLNYTMEYVNNDNGTTKNDLKLGVWFNGKLYENKYIYIDNYVDNDHSIGGYITVWPQSGATIGLKSCNYQLPDNMTDISFRDYDFADIENHQGWAGKEYTGETLDNTLFSGTVIFPKVAGAYITYAGEGLQEGLSFTVAQNENTQEWYLRLAHSNNSLLGTLQNEKIYANAAGVEQLVGAPLELHISMEYVNLDDQGEETDLKLGVWFGDTLYKDEYIYIKDYVGADKTGTYLTYNSKKADGGAITLKSADINLPKNMTEITFRDFGYVDGDISQYPAKQYEGDTLDGTLFGGKITFPEVANVFLQYGGKEAGAGFNLGTAYDDEKEEWYLRLFNAKKAENETNFTEVKLYSDVAQVDALVGEEIELNLTVEYVDYDGDGKKDDVKLGVWFNGKLYNNNYIYLKDYADATYSMGTWMSFSVPSTTKVVIESVGEINWKPLPTGLTEITFRDFGYVDGDITQYPAKQYEGDTLDGTLFGGKITFPEVANVFLQYGGKEAGAGFNLGTAYDDEKEEWYLRLFNAKKAENETNFTEVKLYSDVAQVDALVGEEIELNLTVEYVDYDGDSAKDDVKLGVWFNGKLYNNNYIYLTNYVDATYSMGTWMSFSVAKTTKINIKSVGTIDWKDVPKGMIEITFRDFGFIDGDFTKYPGGQYEGETLDNTLLIGKITFPEYENVFLQYGGKVAGGGFNLGTAKDATTGEWYLRLFDTNQDKSGKKFSEYKFYSNVAGVSLVGEEVALMLSIQYVDKDGDGKKNDVQLGVWFAGKLYNNQYLYLKDFVKTGHSMGTWMAFNIPKVTKVTIKSVGEINWKPLPTGLTEIGFSDFGIASGVYEGGSKVGEYTGENLRNTLFSGIVKWYPEVGETHFIYGGITSEGGFDIVNVTDEKTGEHYLRLFYTTPTKDGKKTYTNYYFYSNVAGVTLVGEELDLKISIEYVDHDGKKTNNDVRLGIWFAGKLYNNRYIYIDNFGATGHIWKNNIQIWNRNGASFGVGRQSDWLNWSAFGLTANWKKILLDTDFNLEYTLRGGNPYTGDDTQIPYSMLITSVAVIALCGCQIVRRRRNGYDL